MKSWPRLLALLVLCIASGYFVGRTVWRPSAPADMAVASTASAHLPAIELPDVSGRRRSIGEWSSQALILNFWATWCAPCRREMPLLEEVHRERSDHGVAIIGIAIDHEEDVRTFLGETGVTYPVLVGQEDAMAIAQAVAPDFVALPMTAIVAPGGEILAVRSGELHPPDLAAILGVLDRLAAGQLSVAGARLELQKG